jgi:polar amino acid transport system ATP-binding protein
VASACCPRRRIGPLQIRLPAERSAGETASRSFCNAIALCTVAIEPNLRPIEADYPICACPVSQADPPVIEIRDLHKSYGQLEVLKGVDLVAPRGQVISLIGSSGSGKSTLLRCCNLLEESQQGEVIFEGEPVRWKGSGLHRHPADKSQVSRIRTNLSMVFQQFNLWSHMTVLENVMEAPLTVLRQNRATVEARARALLEKVGIGDKADAYPAMMSGGQQQRAAIARALCMEPRALLFDEPTSALDPELEQEVVRVIKALAEEGRTMILVTHDMRLAADVSDHVIFLHLGRIEEEGPPGQLFGQPKSERLRQFLSASVAA